MSEALLMAIVGSVSALVGAAIGYFASFYQSKQVFDRQMQVEELELEEKKRQWELEDEQRELQLETKERRCKQLEQLVDQITGEFHEIRASGVDVLDSSDLEDVREQVRGFKQTRTDLETHASSARAIIARLGSDDLYMQWRELEYVLNDMVEMFETIGEKKRDNRDYLPDSPQIVSSIETTSNAFDDHLGRLLYELDQYRTRI